MSHHQQNRIAAALAAGHALGADGFAAIDFETATPERASACAVGAAVVQNGQVHEARVWLIQPPGNSYNRFNVGIHGITPALTFDSPSMAEIWPEVRDFIDDRPVVAHNAAFDMGVLRASLATCGLRCPELTYACTHQLARRVWAGRLSYRLNDLARDGDLRLEHHHADSDAAVAAQLGIAICGAAREADLIDAVRKMGLEPRHLSDLGRPIDPTRRDPHGAAEPPDRSPFLDRTVVFTGQLDLPRDDAVGLVVDAGGRVASAVSELVDYLVVGIEDANRMKDGVRSSTMIAAAALAAGGAPIEMISEREFFEMLPGR